MNIERVYISGELTTLDSEYLKFIDIFPNIHHLSLDHIRVMDLNSFDRHFSQSEHLELEVLSDRENLTFEYAERFLKHNKQIRSFKMWYPSREFLKMLTDTLPNLEVFEVDWELRDKPNEILEEIRFEHLKVLKMKDTFHSKAPYNINFPVLEEIELLCDSDQTIEYSKFIAKHSKLQKLTFKELISSALIYITGKLPKLTEAAINCSGDIQPEIIKIFLDNCTELMKLDLSFLPHSPFTKLQTLRNIIHNEWNIDVERDNIFITRKQ